MTSVVKAQEVRPCQLAVLSLGRPESRPAAYPPTSEARIPDSTHQIPAPRENVETAGLSEVPGSIVAAPTPIPIRFKTSCVTRPTTTPAKTAPQDTRLSRM